MVTQYCETHRHHFLTFVLLTDIFLLIHLVRQLAALSLCQISYQGKFVNKSCKNQNHVKDI